VGDKLPTFLKPNNIVYNSILLDYNASLIDHNDFSADNTATAYPHNTSSSLKNPKITTYELSYGK
jgi:hypothetical protein